MIFPPAVVDRVDDLLADARRLLDSETEALYRALFEEWAEHGFAAVSLERVAARAGAGKAAIYRRWSSRVDFAAEALRALGLRVARVEDHGSLEADVLALLIVVGVAMDTVQQIESQLVMRHYDGFMRKGRVRGRRG